MTNNLISVIIPVYKVEKYLDRCVESVVNQTYKNLEIILVDDGSPDNCPKMCDEWAKKDNRIKVIHKENGGLSDARNAGMDIATGEYIGFVDSDDYIDTTMYEKLITKLLETNSDVAMCDYFEEKTNGERNGSGLILENLTGKNIRGKMLLSTKDRIGEPVWKFLYKKEIVIKFEYGMWYEDVLFQLQALKPTLKLAVVQEPLYHYIVQRDGSITNTYGEKQLQKRIEFLKRLSEILEDLKDEEGNDIVGNYSFFLYFQFYYDLIGCNDKSVRKKYAKLIDELKLNSKENYKWFKKFNKGCKVHIIAFFYYHKITFPIRIYKRLKHLIKN